MDSIVLRRKQVAALLNISLATLWRWQAQGFPALFHLARPAAGVLATGNQMLTPGWRTEGPADEPPKRLSARNIPTAV